MKEIFYLTAATFLTSCTPYIEQLANSCSSFGFQKGTLEFAQCMQQQDAQFQQGMQALSDSIAQQNAVSQQAAAARQYRIHSQEPQKVIICSQFGSCY